MSNFIKLPPSTTSQKEHLVNTADIMKFTASAEKNVFKLKIDFRVQADKHMSVSYEYECAEELDEAFNRLAEFLPVKQFNPGNHKPYKQKPFITYS